MRVHRLRVTAFGPFTDPVEVDGDALAADGLFLLAGPTGAGKSSVLDAICFALYGAVPGRRNEARALRSDLAPPGLAPEVVLEVTLGGHRYRFTRSPSWQRPKKRGSGTTTAQASVSVQRLDGHPDDGWWTHLTHRLDEAGDLVSSLLGMTCPQFCQVAMLPQGEFQTFLHARSDDRQQVLQQLFRTDRYDRIERWLAEHRRETRRVADARAQDVVVLAHRVAEVADLPVPATDRLAGWLTGLLADATAEADTADAAAHLAERGLTTARAALAEVRTIAGDRARHAQALARRDALSARAPDLAADAHRLDGARRYDAVAGLADVAAATAIEQVRAEQAWLDAAAGLDGVDPGGAPDLAGAVADAERHLDRLREAEPAAAELREEQTRVAALAAGAAEDRSVLARLTDDLDSLPAAVEVLRTQVATLAALAASAPLHRSATEQAEAGLVAARRVAALTTEVTGARVEAQHALERKNDRHSTLIAIQEARLTGMAAELAGALAVGEDCPVCGSCDHPSPARATPGAADRAAERDARRALDTAEGELTVHRDRLRGLELSLATARTSAADRDVVTWEADLAAARDELTAAETAAADHPDTTARLAAEEAALAAARQQHDTLVVRVAETATEVRAGTTTVTRLAERLDALVGRDGDLREARHRAETRCSELADAVGAAEALARARDADTRADAAAEASARAHRFADLADARSARLEPAEVAHLEAAAAEHRDAVRDVTACLADPALRAAAAATPVPDVPAAEAACADAERTAGAAVRRQTIAERRLARLGALADDLRDALAALAPAEAEAGRAASVADLASGRSADNRHRLALPAYVLAWRLGQVVAAANVRLGAMTDGRYLLEHQVDPGSQGNRRGGLDLLVRDEWSGGTRSPSTLSGGETFVVSLALALGLADVVSQEADADAAGADIDTLFVDEGFGSLDADILDDVLAVLDELREGGRVVGVVSHVDSMRERIGTRLEVTPGDRGSRVRLVRSG